MRYAVIENEEFARLSLCRMLKDLRPNWELVFTAESVEETIEELQAGNSYPELIFMDIELDDGSCFDIFKQITITCPIVFTTAFENFALQAFEVNSVGYLLKPVTLEKLTKMLVKIEGLGRSLSSAIRTETASEKPASIIPKHGRILISHRDSYSFISSDEVAFFIAEDKCVSVTLKNGTTYLTDFATLSDCMNVLDRNKFFHISRNTVVNIDCISKVTKFFKGRLNVDISAGTATQTVTVSAARKIEFLNWLGYSH
ncbi:MAG: LytTR family DNA-binding domain-containing protein [Muribaculaceae bacterium]|nr:LytTR family DNA-binding domain-containing protein [Muribaculaceae bacterium]